MNRLEKKRDYLANEAYFEEMDRDACNAAKRSLINGWNACASEYEKIIKELVQALRSIERKDNLLFAECADAEEIILTTRKALQKLKEWRGGSYECNV